MDPAKSSQILTLDFFVNFILGKSISASFKNVIFKIFWGSMPELAQKNFLAAGRLENLQAKNLTFNYYNKLATMHCNRFSTILYIIFHNNLITLMNNGITTKYWFVKVITESFTSFVFCFLNILFYYTSNTSIEEEHQVFFDPWQIFQTITDVIVAIPIYVIMILAHFYCQKLLAFRSFCGLHTLDSTKALPWGPYRPPAGKGNDLFMSPKKFLVVVVVVEGWII